MATRGNTGRGSRGACGGTRRRDGSGGGATLNHILISHDPDREFGAKWISDGVKGGVE